MSYAVQTWRDGNATPDVYFTGDLRDAKTYMLGAEKLTVSESVSRCYEYRQGAWRVLTECRYFA